VSPPITLTEIGERASAEFTVRSVTKPKIQQAAMAASLFSEFSLQVILHKKDCHADYVKGNWCSRKGVRDGRKIKK
jgi:hypothetical protein